MLKVYFKKHSLDIAEVWIRSCHCRRIFTNDASSVSTGAIIALQAAAYCVLAYYASLLRNLPLMYTFVVPVRFVW